MRKIILIAFLAPLTYLLFGYSFESAPMEELNHIPTPKVETPIEKDLVLIEINSIPPPFDISGLDPYIVWINGCRVSVPKKHVLDFVDKVGKDKITPITTADIHNGWIQPHYFENVSIEYQHKGRTRSVISENN